jgi:hypothetical protein
VARALAIALALYGCQTSYLVGRGDEALDRGEPDRAVADYLAAVERRASAGEKAEIGEKLERAAIALAEREIEAAKSLAGQGKLEEARLLLWRIAVADAWGAAAAEARVLSALEELDRPRWSEIEALAQRSRFVPAARAAHALIAPYPEGHPVRARFADLVERGTKHHLALARESDEKPLAWLHHRIAVSLGAAPTENLAELERAMAAGAAYAWRVEIDDRACPLLARLIQERLAKSEQRGPVAEVRFERCREVDQSWSEREKRTYQDRVPRPRFVEEQHWVEVRDPSCDVEACLRYDELGVCLERPPLPEICSRVERKLAVRQVPVIEYEPVQKELEIEVLRRKVEIEAAGRIRFDGADPSPFEVVELVNDRAYWSPSGSKRFTGADRARVVENAFAQVKQALDRSVAEVRAQRAIAASRAEEGERAEVLHVLAVSASGTVPAPAAAHFDASYGMTEQDVLHVFGGGALFAPIEAPRARELPPAELDPDLDRFEQALVVRQQDVTGLALMAEIGVDLAFTGGSSALRTADLVYGFEARMRVSRLLVSGSAQTTVLAGDVGGFGLSLTGLTFDLAKTGVFFGWGLAYAQQQTDAGEKYRIFTIPLAIHVPIASWIWFGASFEPNLLFAKTIFDDADDDPHFWSPIRAWFVLDLYQRVYLQAGAAHHLGAGFAQKPVQAELMLGVRL